jgi:hypothetical protein
MERLADALRTVRSERDFVAGGMEALKMQLDKIVGGWNSPAGSAFATLSIDLRNVSTDVLSVLDDSILSMQKTYDNYLEAEGMNTKSLQSNASYTASPSLQSNTASITARP